MDISRQTMYAIHFYEGEEQIFGFHAFAPPNVKKDDIVHLVIHKDDLFYKLRADYKVIEIKYSFESYTMYTTIYVEIMVEKIGD